MKNLTLTFAAMAFVCLSSFTTIKQNNENSFKTDDRTVDCRWRTVYYHSDGKVSYSEYTYGNCNVTESGNLIPIQ